ETRRRLPRRRKSRPVLLRPSNRIGGHGLRAADRPLRRAVHDRGPTRHAIARHGRTGLSAARRLPRRRHVRGARGGNGRRGPFLTVRLHEPHPTKGTGTVTDQVRVRVYGYGRSGHAYASRLRNRGYTVAAYDLVDGTVALVDGERDRSALLAVL